MVLANSACGFSVSGSAPSDGAPDEDASVDANADAAIDAPIDSPPVIPFCDATDSTLIGCWEFENTADNASAINLTVTATALSFVTGRVGMAGRFDATTSVTVAENTAFATLSYTIEAWVKLPAQPTSERMAVLDNDGEYLSLIHI